MEKPEITSGLKNAIERGYSLEQAKKSFLNAGYNPQDIEDSASSVAGFPALMSGSQNQQQPQNQQSSMNNPQISTPSAQYSYQKQTTQFNIVKPKKSHKGLILVILLVFILLLLLGILGASIFYKDGLISMLAKIGINLSV